MSSMITAAPEKEKLSVLLRLHPLKRLVISTLIATAGFFIMRRFDSGLVSGIFMWCVFSFVYLMLSLVIIIKRSIEQIRRVATVQDGSNVFVFVLILLSSFASMVTVLILITSKHASRHDGYVVTACAIAILLSWMMVHTTFTFHYAHLFYDDDPDNIGDCIRGLVFPKTTVPDYLDFAYFSFVIGMTFQVSDVQITLPKIRRLVLVHALISFVYNTFIVALAINLIAGLNN